MSLQEAQKLGGILGQQLHQTDKTCTVIYGSKISIYNKQSKKIVHEIDQFDTSIVTFKISNNWVFAVDKSGVVKSFNFNPEEQSQKINNCNNNITPVFTFELKQNIISAQFDSLNDRLFFVNELGEIQMLLINSQKPFVCNLQNNNKNIKNKLIVENQQQIVLSQSEDVLVYSSGKKIEIYSVSDEYQTNNNNNKKTEQYQPAKFTKNLNIYNNISALTISKDDEVLIVGDDQGKITHFKDFLGTPTISVQHWHSTPVTALLLNSKSSVLYSGGGEGVLVVWQQFEDKKDFYPRLGSPIIGLFLDEHEISLTTLLKENTIKSIKLHNFAEDYCLQNISNPRSQRTFLSENQSSLKTPIFQAGFQQHPSQNVVVTNSLPGRLQFIDIFQQQKKRDLDVIYRNLTSMSDKQTPNPSDVQSFSFDDTFSCLCAASHSTQSNKFQSSLSCLRFLEEQQNQNSGYELTTKIENPHGEDITGVASFYSVVQQAHIFVTYGTDNKVKLWKKFKRQVAQRRRKQDEEDNLQFYWNSYKEETFKNQIIVQVLAFSENDMDYLYVLTQNALFKFNATQNKVENEFFIDAQNTPKKFLKVEERIYVIFSNILQVFDCQQNQKIFELPLETIVDIANFDSQVSLLLSIANQTAIVKLNADFSQNLEIFVLNNTLTQIFYARSGPEKQQLIGVDLNLNFIILEEQFNAEKDIEIEQEQQEENNEENAKTEQTGDFTHNSLNVKGSKKVQTFQQIFSQHLQNNLRDEGDKLANFFPTNSHAIPPAGLIFNNFADKFLISNSREQEKYKQFLRQLEEQKKAQKLMEIENSDDEDDSDDSDIEIQKLSKRPKQIKNNNYKTGQNQEQQQQISETDFKKLQNQINDIFQ